MYYLLNDQFLLRGWQKLPYALVHEPSKKARFLGKEQFALIEKCNGFHDLKIEELPEQAKKFMEDLLNNQVIQEAFFGQSLLPEQEYKCYPCRHKRDVHWSITGLCNLKCRHCFMSAPGGKHGNPSYEQLIKMVDQFEECGIYQVSLTGGEPLVRPDFMDLVRELTKRKIAITCIYTNGWLVDEKLLDSLLELGIKPPFQLSYDGVGCHDFLRGVEGAEERTLNALKMLQERGFRVSVSTCLHKGNVHTIRETVNLMHSYGVRSMKIGAPQEYGDWATQELRELILTPDEELEAFEKYIPYFFEDGAPISVMLSGTFSYQKEEESWCFNYFRPCPTKWEGQVLSCPSIKHGFYLGADGMVAPCMGICDCSFAVNLPNAFQQDLKEILGDSYFMDLCSTTVQQVRDGNDKCRDCEYVSKCTGGCRNGALLTSDNFYDVDKDTCYFYEHGWDKRLFDAADPAYKRYCEKNGLTPKDPYDGPVDEEGNDLC